MGWTFFWLMVVLKVPIIAAIVLVWWAVRAEPEAVEPEPEPEGEGEDDEGGSKVPAAHRSLPRRPLRPRGPHGTPAPPAPPRVRKRTLARASERAGRG